MALVAFGSDPDRDEDPGFARWWLSLPPEFRIAKGDARREWKKLRPSPELQRVMTEAIYAQSQTTKWQEGYRTTPARWIRGERWEDYVGEERRVRPRCEHVPPCVNPFWCQVVSKREAGEI